MLLCGWTKRKKKESTSQDRYDKCVPPVEDQKQESETSAIENIAGKSEDSEDFEDPQISNQSMHPFFKLHSFDYCEDVDVDKSGTHSKVLTESCQVCSSKKDIQCRNILDVSPMNLNEYVQQYDILKVLVWSEFNQRELEIHG